MGAREGLSTQQLAPVKRAPRRSEQTSPSVVLNHLCIVCLALCGLTVCSDPGHAHQGAAVPREHIAELEQTFGFTKSVEPVRFDPARDAPPGGANAAACGECHSAVYSNWMQSRHRVALTNPLYRESHAREPSVWCVNCHAPLLPTGADARDKKERVLSEEGVSCAVCHVRQGRILTGGLPAPGREDGKHEHRYQIAPVMRTSSFCAECHQFNFPQAAHQGLPGQTIRYASLVMQDTHTEWNASSFASQGTCQTCHLGSGDQVAHRFSGGHDLARLSGALQVRARRLEQNLAEVSVISIGIGHAFPTGDLFRALRLRIVDGKRRVLVEFLLKRTFLPLGRAKAAAHLSTKVLISDTTVPPPQGDYGASRSFIIPLSEQGQLFYELEIDYLNDINHLLTGLSPELTVGRIKRGRLEFR